MSATPAEKFADEFLRHYLRNGMGSLSKSDVDALVMHLLDKYIHVNGIPLQQKSNQALSETLRIPLTKVKRLRYEAGLKFGVSVGLIAKQRFAECLSLAVIHVVPTTEKGKNSKPIINVIIEDTLARNWIQDQLKSQGILSDTSFNREIVSTDANDFLRLLELLLSDDQLSTFTAKYNQIINQQNTNDIKREFSNLLKASLEGAASTLGATTATALIKLPLLGS